MTQHTQTIARFVGSLRFEQLPPAMVAKIIAAFIDTSGVMLAGSRDEAGEIVTDLVREAGGAAQSGVIGSGLRVPATQAAFANGVFGHALDYDDMHGTALCHITSILVPVIYALGSSARIDGRTAIAAYAAGMEVIFHLGRAFAMRTVARTTHATPMTGSIGAACTAARLMNLDEAQTRFAMAIAASSTAGLRSNVGSMTKAFHTGSAARNGILAAQLAAKGFTADEQILDSAMGYTRAFGPKEGPPPEFLDTLGVEFKAHEGLEFKAYPACGRAHAALDAIFSLIGEHDVRAEDIERIECICSDAVPQVLIHNFARTGLEGKFSMQYSLAVALLDRHVGLRQYSDERASQDDVQALQRKMTYVHPPGMPGWEGGSVISNETVKLYLHDGRVLSRREPRQLGRLGGEVSVALLEAKFHECADGVLDAGTVAKVLGLLRQLDSIADIGEVEALLSRTAG